MDILTDEQIEARILQKLHRRGNWGASHTSFENVKKWFTQRYRKAGRKKGGQDHDGSHQEGPDRVKTHRIWIGGQP